MTPVNPCARSKFSPGIILLVYLLEQRTQTGRGKFISNINDHLGLKPTDSIVTIATRE